MNIVNDKEVDFVKVKPGKVEIFFKDKTFISIKDVDIYIKEE